MGRYTVITWAMYTGMTEKDPGAMYDDLRTILPVKGHVVLWSKKQ